MLIYTGFNTIHTSSEPLKTTCYAMSYFKQDLQLHKTW